MKREIEAYKEFHESGGTLYVPTPEEKTLFRDAAAGMRDWYVDKYGREWLEKLDRAIANCESQVDAAYERAISD